MGETNRKFVLHADSGYNQGARIKVIGIGGGGSNAVDRMATELIEGVEFYIANTDAQALGRARTQNKIQFGIHTTRGHGAGFDPQKGREAAMEDREQFMETLGDAEMYFITAGLGGGTGTGAAPVFAKAIKECSPDALVVAVVTTPFSFEGPRRIEFAESGVKELSQSVDSIIAIPNDKILVGDVSLYDAYGTANDVLLNAVCGIADVIVHAGFINVDFADVKTIMSEDGMTLMGHGRAAGENRAVKATESALAHPLLAEIDIARARGILVNVTASSSISTSEYKEIGEMIHAAAGKAKSIISGLVFNEDIGDEICVTLIASGLQAPGEDVFSTHHSKFNPAFPEAESSDTNSVEHAGSNDEVFEDSDSDSQTSPFVDSPELYDYESQEFPESEEIEHVPSILRNHGHFRPGTHLNGSAEL